MKRISVVFCLACFSALFLDTGVVSGQSDGSIVGWGYQVVVEQSALDSLVAVAAGGAHNLGLKSYGAIVAWGWNIHGQCNVPAPNANFVAVAGGFSHSLGLKSDGVIVAWGRNDHGQCDVPAPNADFVAVAAGWCYSLGLKSNGTIVAWGWNMEGVCEVPDPNADFVAIAAGYLHCLGVKSDGSIVAWGSNVSGACYVPEPNADFVAVSGGWYHSLGLKSDGTIVGWGYNNDGQCDVPAPNADFVAIAAGKYSSLGLKSDGTIVAWGDNDYGQCDVPAPNADFVAVACGGIEWGAPDRSSAHSLGLKSNGTVAAWGSNYFGECNVPAPNVDFVAVAAGGDGTDCHSLGLRPDGTIVAWGRNDDGQCDVPAPNADFVAVAAGVYHSLGLKSDGTIAAWGLNDESQCDVPAPNADFVAVAGGWAHSLGLKSDGTIVVWGNYGYPVPAPNTDFVAIAAGYIHSLGLKSDGTIVAWGQNSDGQCDVPAPNTDFVAVAAGWYHSLGLKSNGTIVAWGDIYYGQCNVPEPNTDFMAVAAGFAHSLGLKSDGTIVAWGLNSNGQCNVPDPNADFVAAAAGFAHSLGLKSSTATPCLVWNTNDSGAGSLRQAIIDANAAPDWSVIRFAIDGTGPHAIQPLTPLPAVTAPVSIDGYTQPGASANTNGDGLGGNAVLKIELDGSALSGSTDHGLHITAGRSTVRGLVINSFPGSGIRLESDGNFVEGNYVGTNFTGSLALPNNVGIRVSGDDNIVGGTEPAARNVISGNTTDGVYMLNSSSSWIQGNFIGVSASGTSGIANNTNGVRLATAANDNVIDNNVISGNTSHGVLVSATTGGYGNSIRRNYIGTNGTGTISLGNGVHGIHIALTSMSGAAITVGGAPGYANLIANNGGDGVNINLRAAATLRAIVSHNTIHSNDNGIVLTSGNATLSKNNIFSNAGLGIDLDDDGVTANDPGDPDSGPNDLQNFPVLMDADPATGQIQGILESEPDRIYIIELFASSVSGSDPCDPSGYGEGERFLDSTSVSTDGLGHGSFSVTVSELFGSGESLTATATDFIRGNTSEFSECFPVTGPILVRNTNNSGSWSLRQAIIDANASPDKSTIAFYISGTGPHTIQPLTPLPAVTAPVIIDGYTQPGASANTNGDGLGGNAVLKIELDGSALSGSTDHGLDVTAGHSTVRGLVINRFPGNGIYLMSDSNVVEGNYIGIDIIGATAQPNSLGIYVRGDNNIVGGTEPAARNVISGNTGDGVLVINSTSNWIQGNFIGVSASGTSGVANNTTGVRLGKSSNTVIDKNVISSNATYGVSAGPTNVFGNIIRRNYVGTDVTGTLPLGNGSDGVHISALGGAGAAIIIGGSPANANLIANNGGDGVNLLLPADGTLRANVRYNTIRSNDNGIVVTQGNATLSRNNIFSNAGLGIDLNDDGVTANDPGDPDTGPNGLQNFPVLFMVKPKKLTVAGELGSTPSTEFDLEFFSSASCDSSGFGEGATYLGEARVTTDALGTAGFEEALYAQIPGGHYITATARPVSGGGTSEFSQCIEFINTQPGTNVSVTPVDEATGETPVDLTFDEVKAAGNTTLEITDTGPAVPGTFIVGDPATYYNLSTTATFSDSILVCFSYDEAEIPGAEEDLVILHYDTLLVPPDWEDITVSLDTLSNVVCGRTATLSPFVLAVPNSATGVDPMPEAPAGYALYQNVPNPFNPTTTIRFDLPCAEHVKLCVYNVKGDLIVTIVDRYMTEGRKEINWTAKDNRGRAVSSGIYFYRLVAGDFVQTKKMVLLK